MSYFEYNYTGELSATFEQKTKEIVDLVSQGIVPFYVVKYWDDTIEGTDKKKENIGIIITNESCQLFSD